MQQIHTTRRQQYEYSTFTVTENILYYFVFFKSAKYHLPPHPNYCMARTNNATRMYIWHMLLIFCICFFPFFINDVYCITYLSGQEILKTGFLKSFFEPVRTPEQWARYCSDSTQISYLNF